MTHKEIADKMFSHNPAKHAEIQHYLSLNDEQRKVYDEETMTTYNRDSVLKSVATLDECLRECEHDEFGNPYRDEVDNLIRGFAENFRSVNTILDIQ